MVSSPKNPPNKCYTPTCDNQTKPVPASSPTVYWTYCTHCQALYIQLHDTLNRTSVTIDDLYDTHALIARAKGMEPQKQSEAP
jgi:hypothetical protein